LAEPKGFLNGVKFLGVEGIQKDTPIEIGSKRPICFMEDADQNKMGLYCENSWIYYKGKWATIL